MDLVFQLERGGADGFKRLPVVWRVDEAFDPHSLERRFASDWIDWYGPGLRRHAQVIARQLASDQASGDAFGQGNATGLQRWWAMPVVRRRNRRLRITLTPPVAGHGPGWPFDARSAVGRTMHGGARLGLSLLQYWGAASDQAAQPGPAVWCDCSERASIQPLLLPSFDLTDGWTGEGGAPPPPQCIEHRLHDGIGLLVLVPSWADMLRSDPVGQGASVGDLA